MAVVSKTRSTLEGLVRDSSLKWLLGKRSYFDEELEEIERSPSAQRNWITELSPFANVVVRRCSKILGVSASELQESFNVEAIDSIKVSSNYARNFLEYCSFRALALSTQNTGYLADKRFRRLTFDMMIAWEAPASSSQPVLNIAEDASVGVEAFSRIAPAVPIISNVIISENLFEMLTSSAGARLQLSVYERYLGALEKVIRKMKNLSESNLLQSERTLREERILEMDGTVTTQPVLEHVGISTWPGRLVLTDHALYFEALRVVSFDKAKRYDLSEDLKQVIKPELAGPWGTRLFDKAILYKSVSLSEPVVIEFPELKGHTRRDFWLAIIREVLYVHRFINKFQIKGIQRNEALSKAVLGILRLQAIQDMCSSIPSPGCESLLMFNLCDQLPGGDFILETLANMSDMKESDRTNKSIHDNGMYSISAFDLASHLGFGMGTAGTDSSENELLVGEIAVGKVTPLERAVKESRNNYEKVVMAQETVDGAKVDGIDTNLAVMKELMLPVSELGKCLLSLARWEDPMKSLAFCLVSSFIIYRDWLAYVFALLLTFMAVFMMLTRFLNQGTPVEEVKVIAPPPMNAMEQLLAVQNAISHAEQFIQDGNIVLLKLRALLLAIFPQATMKFAACLVVIAITLGFVPTKYVVLMVFLEGFTMYSPPRKASTERWIRRIREWWFSIPAAPVFLDRENEDKKRK